MLDAVGWSHDWLCDLVVAEINSVSDFDVMGCFRCESLAPIVFQRHAYTPSVFAPEIPRVARIWFEVCDNSASERPERRGIVVEGTFKEFVGRDLWVER